MINMIFDATILLSWNNKDSLRSGAFFAAKNVYDRLQNNPNFNIYLYFTINDMDYFLTNSVVFTKPFVNDFNNFVWKFFWFFNKKMWNAHKKLFSHVFLRKPFALGIVISQLILRKMNPVDRNIVSKCQVYFSPIYSVPKSIRKHKHLSFFTMLYDTIPFWMPEDCGPYWTRELKKIVYGAEKKDYFICDSFNSFKDFNKINPNISSENTSVVLLAADDKFHEGKNEAALVKLMEKYGVPIKKRYVFCLSSVSPRKNFKRMIETFVRFVKENNVQDLVIVVSGSGSKNIVPKLMEDHPGEKKLISKCVFSTGYIDDDEKILLYQHAEWFVYTSRYEGFGLPPLEAMQCGCPVITSNNSSLPEVVGDAAVMIDWDDDSEHIDAYKLLYENNAFRDSLRVKGLSQAKKFNWDKTVYQIELAIMKRVLST